MPAHPASWGSFLTAVFAFFLVMAGTTLPTPLYPIYAERYGFSGLDITIIFAAYAVGVIAALIGTGPWSDEIGRKPMLYAGLAAALAAGGVFLFADGMATILPARVLQGLSAGIFTATATVAVNELAPGPRVGGVGATAANMAGLGMGPILAALVLVTLPAPLRMPYLLHIGLVVLVGLALLAVPEPHGRKASPRLRSQPLSVPGEVRGLFVPAAIAAFAGFMICGFMTASVPAFLGDVLGRGGAHLLIGTTAGLIFLASCLGQIGADAIPQRHTLTLGVAGLTIGVAAISGAMAWQNLPALIAAIILAGLAHGVAFKGGLAALGRAAPDDRQASVTAAYFTVAYVSISIPVVILGALQGRVGQLAASVGYGVAATILSALALLMLLVRRD